jgi:Septum formation initiator
MLVPSLFQWWRQEQDLRDITARVAAAEQQNADMQHQLDLWNDPDYIASQARSRLGYVLPGETQYSVVDPGPDHADTSQIEAAEPQGPARPWVQVLSLSLTAADAPKE